MTINAEYLLGVLFMFVFQLVIVTLGVWLGNLMSRKK